VPKPIPCQPRRWRRGCSRTPEVVGKRPKRKAHQQVPATPARPRCRITQMTRIVGAPPGGWWISSIGRNSPHEKICLATVTPTSSGRTGCRSSASREWCRPRTGPAVTADISKSDRSDNGGAIPVVSNAGRADHVNAGLADILVVMPGRVSRCVTAHG